VSLYRQPGRIARRTLATAVAVTLVVGAGGGYLAGRATAPDASLADQLTTLRDDLRPAEQGIELAATEYGPSVRDGRVSAPTEYAAAKAAIARASETVDAAAPDLRTLDPAAATALTRAIDELSGAIDAKADQAEVVRRSETAARALDEARP
jgi:hypothetical protein